MDGTLPPNQYNQVTLQNCDTQPFDVIYNNFLYKTMQAGEVVKLPKFLADHALKHLLDQILNHLDVPVNNVEQRKKWAEKVVIGEDTYEAPVQLSANEKLAKEVDQMNGIGLDSILASKKKAVDVPDEEGMLPEIDEEALDKLPPEPVVPLPSLDGPPSVTPNQPIATVQPQATENPVPSIPDVAPTQSNSQPVGETPVIATAPDPELVAVDNKNTVPTRQDLYAFATNVMKMDLGDPKTMAALENMSVPELARELQYSEQTV